MPADEDTIICDDVEDPDSRSRSRGKAAQLADARLKAVESRRKAQRSRLEQRLIEVKTRLGDMDPERIEQILSCMLSQEAEILDKVVETLQGESRKRAEEIASVKRHVDAVKEELRALRHTMAKLRPTVTSLAALTRI